jgi:predicted SAM-dependent methyltransferase
LSEISSTVTLRRPKLKGQLAPAVRRPRASAAKRQRAQKVPAKAEARHVLHVGCGHRSPRRLHQVFGKQWKEIRVDIDPAVKPHFVSSMTDLSGCIPDQSVDAIWSSHSIEHLHSFEVPAAFKEFARVLKPHGFMLATCPDIEQIAELLLKSEIDSPAYMSPAGPITPMDMIFGHQKSIREGNHFMSHRTAFTQQLIGTLLVDAGFAEVRVRRGTNFDMWCLAMMRRTKIDAVLSLLQRSGLDFRETLRG